MATGRIGVTPTLGVRWSKAPTGGTTALSGLDDSSVSLVYSVGYEQVYRNGVLLSRGNDYTATTGTSITLIDATITGDIIEVFAQQLVPLADAISKGQFTAKGTLLSATAASTPGVLGVGANATVLTADSTEATGLKWATPAAGGKVLQVVSTTKTDTFTTSSTSFVDITGLSVSITPTLNTSKIMVLVSLQASGETGSNSASCRLMRGATAIFIGDAASSRDRASADIMGGITSNRVTSSQGPMTLDAPATTAALTYKVQIKSTTAGNCFVNRGSADTDDGGHQRMASSITVMEIGA